MTVEEADLDAELELLETPSCPVREDPQTKWSAVQGDPPVHSQTPRAALTAGGSREPQWQPRGVGESEAVV